MMEPAEFTTETDPADIRNFINCIPDEVLENLEETDNIIVDLYGHRIMQFQLEYFSYPETISEYRFCLRLRARGARAKALPPGLTYFATVLATNQAGSEELRKALHESSEMGGKTVFTASNDDTYGGFPMEALLDGT